MANIKKNFSTSSKNGSQSAGGTWQAGTGTNTTGLNLTNKTTRSNIKPGIKKIRTPKAAGTTATDTTLASGMNTLKTNIANMKTGITANKANLKTNMANMKTNMANMKANVTKIKKKRGLKDGAGQY